ncbi:ABC-three component system protein [Rhizobium ruizarguesonis]
MTLNPNQLIQGSQIEGFPKAYVIGAYDTRITFYSQQVRALALAHALHVEHHIGPNSRIGIVGGGAAGVTLAAALAVQSDAVIQLFEKSEVLMPLQRAATRRRLDPRIYEWPRNDAEHEIAELPILDWTSGSAADVRKAVLGEFEAVRAATENHITVHLNHKIGAVNTTAHGYRIYFERNGAGGAREQAQTEVDLLFFTFGFGLELPRPIRHTPTESYWLDGGVPGAAIDGKARPCFFISGNGDGGLIDFVAAASAEFDHDAMIRAIAHREGVMALRDELLAIDGEARAAEVAGNGYDFIAAYDEKIGARIAALGVIDEIAAQLRPGVQLILQTRDSNLMSIKTATLNRLATYLVIKACEQDPVRHFEHVVCENVTPIDPPNEVDAPSFLLDCDGRPISADKVIARRGPDRDAARAPFAAILANFEAQHRVWVGQFPEDSITPTLSEDARAHFVRLSKDKKLPLPRYRHEAAAQVMPLRVKVAQHGQMARWSGDITLDQATTIWGRDARPSKLLIDATPEPLGPLAFATARLGLHCQQPWFEVDIPRWQPFLARLSCESRHATNLPLPTLRARSNDASTLNASDSLPSEMATRLHETMDRWILDKISGHLNGYLTRGEDPGHLIPFKAAADISAVMSTTWTEWRAAFIAHPPLLARFLRLSVCAQDSIDLVEEARCLVGPLLMKQLTGAIAVTLAIASVWQVMAPHDAPPGNLTRISGSAIRTGHSCAAEFIDGDLTPIRAFKFMWRTHFVVLPMVNSPSGFSTMADTSLIKTELIVPRLTEPGQTSNLVLTVDQAFIEAVGTSVEVLSALLDVAEEAHFVHMAKAIEKSQEVPA